MQAVLDYNVLPSTKLTKGALGLAWLIDASKGIINNIISQFLSIILFPVFVFILLPCLFYFNHVLKGVYKKDFQTIIKNPKLFKIAMSHYQDLKANRYLTLFLTQIPYATFPIGMWVAVGQFRQLFSHLLQYTDKLGTTLSTINQTPKDNLFQHIDNDTLWNNRTKVYDYLA